MKIDRRLWYIRETYHPSSCWLTFPLSKDRNCHKTFLISSNFSDYTRVLLMYHLLPRTNSSSVIRLLYCIYIQTSTSGFQVLYFNFLYVHCKRNIFSLRQLQVLYLDKTVELCRIMSAWGTAAHTVQDFLWVSILSYRLAHKLLL